MKFLASIMILLLFSGCTTFRPVELESRQLQEKLSAGEIIHVKDKVKIHTSDGVNHRFKVKEMSDGLIAGSKGNVRIEDIVSLEKREFSAVKTILLVGATVYFISVLAAAGSADAAILAAGAP